MSNEDEYRKKYEELTKKLSDPKIGKKINQYLTKVMDLVGFEVEISFKIAPHLDDYNDVRESDDYEIPTPTTVKLGAFKEALARESDDDLDVYIDPIYLKKGVNEIVDFLITTIEHQMIIVPISNNPIKNEEKE